MKWPRRKTERYDNSPELPTSLNELREEIASCTKQIEAAEAEMARLFSEKSAGDLHDGEYNVATSYLAQRIEPLRQRREKLLRQTDIVQRDLGRKALED